MFIGGTTALSLDAHPRLAARLSSPIADEDEDDSPAPTPRPRRHRAKLDALAAAFLDENARTVLALHLGGALQPAIAEHLHVSQQAVSQRLAGAVATLQWAARLETWRASTFDLRRDLGEHLRSAELCTVETLWPARLARETAARSLGVRVRSLNHLLRSTLRSITRRKELPYARDIERSLAWHPSGAIHWG